MEKVWTEGRFGSMVCLDVHQHHNGTFTASAETEHITQTQMRKALIQECPELSFVIREERGYFIAKAESVGA